jgi:hypothetical protein
VQQLFAIWQTCQAGQINRAMLQAALEACQCWCKQAFVRQVALVSLTFVVLQCLRQ